MGQGQSWRTVVWRARLRQHFLSLALRSEGAVEARRLRSARGLRGLLRAERRGAGSGLLKWPRTGLAFSFSFNGKGQLEVCD